MVLKKQMNDANDIGSATKIFMQFLYRTQKPRVSEQCADTNGKRCNSYMYVFPTVNFTLGSATK